MFGLTSRVGPTVRAKDKRANHKSIDRADGGVKSKALNYTTVTIDAEKANIKVSPKPKRQRISRMKSATSMDFSSNPRFTKKLRCLKEPSDITISISKSPRKVV